MWSPHYIKQSDILSQCHVTKPEICKWKAHTITLSITTQFLLVGACRHKRWILDVTRMSFWRPLHIFSASSTLKCIDLAMHKHHKKRVHPPSPRIVSQWTPCKDIYLMKKTLTIDLSFYTTLFASCDGTSSGSGNPSDVFSLMSNDNDIDTRRKLLSTRRKCN